MHPVLLETRLSFQQRRHVELNGTSMNAPGNSNFAGDEEGKKNRRNAGGNSTAFDANEERVEDKKRQVFAASILRLPGRGGNFGRFICESVFRGIFQVEELRKHHLQLRYEQKLKKKIAHEDFSKMLNEFIHT